jgi:RNA polymerase sigma factor (sigma-70 family)
MTKSGLSRAVDSSLPVAARLVQDDDAQLLACWRAGDREAGQALLVRHFASLYRFFHNKCSDADELVQATLLACLNATQQFRGEASFRTYLFTIARHKLYRYLRARQRNIVLDVTTTSIAQVSTTLRTVIARNQAHRALLDALRALPLEQQTLLELYYWEDLDTHQLAAIFEVRVGTIQIRLFRARARLRELVLTSAPEALEDLDRIARKAGGPDPDPVTGDVL